MIKFTKKDLNFLSTFESCVDTKTPIGDKFQISAIKERNVVLFSQFSDETTLITKIDRIVDVDFKVTFTTLEFFNLIKLIDTETEITITANGIEFNSNKYDLTNHTFELGDTNHYLKVIEEKTPKTIIFNELTKIASVKKYIGLTDGINCITSQNSHFVTCDPETYSGFVKTNNTNEGVFNFSEKVVELFSKSKLSIVEVNIFEADEFYYFKMENTFVLVSIRKYNLPDMFREDIAAVYNHPDKVSVEKESLVKALNRMRFVCSKPNILNSRALITFGEDTIKFELKEKNVGYASEIVLAKVDKPLVNFSFFVSTTNLSNIVNEFSGKEIYIYSPTDSDGVVIKVEDDVKDKYYLLNILELKY